MSSQTQTTSSPKRIFCYGDSLTAGTAPPSDQLFPYGPHLEEELNRCSNSAQAAVMVRWRGLPGWAASALVEYIDDSTYGLRATLTGIRNPSISLVIILAGTNDIGSLTSSMMGGGSKNSIDANLAVDPILCLHKSCLECEGDDGKRNIHTLAVGIPGSAWQEMNPDASKLCAEMNYALKKFASDGASDGDDSSRVTYVDFPFSYSRGDSKWSGDGLHLSQEGYETLGKCLAPCVKEILDRED
ncbi:hypothetical protein ACHAXR_001274 [Thalassiosira sp. AJA248-18]